MKHNLILIVVTPIISWSTDKIATLYAFILIKPYLNPIQIVLSNNFDPLQGDNNFLKIASLHENPWNWRIRSKMVNGSAMTQRRTDEQSAKPSAKMTGTIGTGIECSSQSNAKMVWRWESRWSEHALVLHESEPLVAGRNLGPLQRYNTTYYWLSS